MKSRKIQKWELNAIKIEAVTMLWDTERYIYHKKRTPAARHTSFLFMLASEQVRLAGGKRLEVNTYEMARQSRAAETKDSENE